MKRMVKIEFALLAAFSTVCALVAPPAIIWIYASFAMLLVVLAILQ